MTQLVSFYENEPLKVRNLSVLQMPLEDAEAYKFGNEPTVARVVYVRHPRTAGRLIPFGQYDDLIMMDKFNEALRIVQTLGAFRVVTQTYKGDISKLRGGAAAGAARAGIEITKSGSREVTFEQLGTGGPPEDPAPILWPDEPGFEAARRAVLMNGSHQVSITIESRSAFRLDSDIAYGLKKAGFKLGVGSERAQLQMLRLIAHFPQDGQIPDLGQIEEASVETSADGPPASKRGRLRPGARAGRR